MNRSTLGAGLFLLTTSASFASGFAIVEQSVKGLGSAFSNTAEASDASAMFFNAAALGRLRGTEAMAATHVIAPSAEFTDGGSFLTPAVTGGIAVEAA